MYLHKFIFSKGRYRLARHLVFWLAWILFSSIVQLTNIRLDTFEWRDLAFYQLLRTLTRLPSPLIFCYVTVYLLVPKFIPSKRYWLFLLSLMLFSVLLYFFNYYVLTPYYSAPAYLIGGAFRNMAVTSPFVKKFFSFYSNINFTGAVPACCLMLAVKYYKDWFIKQKQSEILLLENTQAELLLLKAQVHPHFLFNTLNNIYAFTLTKQPRAADLVDQLAGMAYYMSKEGAQPLVPVSRELQLIQDYIGLEKIRYGDRLEMQQEITGDCDHKMIAPLLMIPFVENSFKHGTSKMRGKQWINLRISITEYDLVFTLSNSMPALSQIDEDQKGGIGLKNVQKRLQLLYPGKHQLKIESTEEIFTIHMQLQLEKYQEEEERTSAFSTEKKSTYV